MHGCSIAIGLGVLALVLAFKRLVRARCGGRGRFRSGGPGGSFWLRSIFSRLDTTPGQEREIRGAIEDFQKTAWSAKEGLQRTREGLARAVRGDAFDEVAIGDVEVRVDSAATDMKLALDAALRRIHVVLDVHQRERLADLIEKGRRWRGSGHGGPYRSVLRV